MIWSRRDVKNPQVITASETMRLAAVGREYSSLELLNLDTGETVKRIRGGRACYFSTEDETFLTVGNDWCRLDTVDTQSGARWKINGIMHATVTCTHIALARSLTWGTMSLDQILHGEETTDCSGGSFCLYHRDGTLVFQDTQPRGINVLRTAWSSDRQEWYAISYSTHKGLYWLHRYSGEGAILQKVELGLCGEVDFLCEGKYLVTAEGIVYSLPNLIIIWSFAVA